MNKLEETFGIVISIEYLTEGDFFRNNIFFQTQSVNRLIKYALLIE